VSADEPKPEEPEAPPFSTCANDCCEALAEDCRGAEAFAVASVAAGAGAASAAGSTPNVSAMVAAVADPMAGRTFLQDNPTRAGPRAAPGFGDEGVVAERGVGLKEVMEQRPLSSVGGE